MEHHSRVGNALNFEKF